MNTPALSLYASAGFQRGRRAVYRPKGLEYEVDAFEGQGAILGRPVACCTANFQVKSHAGYELDDDDLRDVEALHRKFGVPLLAEHKR